MPLLLPVMRTVLPVSEGLKVLFGMRNERRSVLPKDSVLGGSAIDAMLARLGMQVG